MIGCFTSKVGQSDPLEELMKEMLGKQHENRTACKTTGIYGNNGSPS
jgi:hypothetical protein